MSADNGIYIAEFPDGFRVIHAQAIDNLDYYPEGSMEYYNEIYRYFKDAPVFSTKSAALDYASQLEQSYDFTEYGICTLGQLPHWDAEINRQYGGVKVRPDRELMEALFTELKDLVSGESCDHSVGICWCDTFRLLNEVDSKLKGNKYFKPE